VRVDLSARDEALVRGLARFRIATTRQLARLYFPGIRVDTVTTRLRKLFNAELLDVVASGVNVENVYGLGPGARRWLEDRSIPVRPVPRSPLQHHLGIVDVWCRVAAALHGRRDVRLARLVPDWECRAEVTAAPPTVVPDATIDLLIQDRTVRVFVEVDLGTERHGALKRKLETYAADRYVDGAWLAVVLAGAGPRRAGAVERLVAEHWPGWSVVCGAEEWPGPLLAAPQIQLAGPLTGSAHGEGTEKPTSSSAVGSSARRGEPPSLEDSHG
jgi:hypothetical protein